MKLLPTSVLLASLVLPGIAYAAPVEKSAAPQHPAVVRTTAPKVTGEAPTQNMPKIVERQLKNGIPVYIAVCDKVPLVNLFTLFTSGGSKNDPVGKYGLAAFVDNCLDEGCGDRDSLEFAKACDMLGASISSSISWDSFAATASCVNRQLPKVLDLYADMILSPQFPEKELERIKKETMLSFINARTSPDSLASIAFNRYVFGSDSRYGTLRLGTQEQVASFTRQDVLDYYQRNIRPKNAFIVCCGDVNPDEIVELLNKRIGSWKVRKPEREYEQREPVAPPAVTPRFIPEVVKPKADAEFNNEIIIIDRPGAHQAAIRVGGLGVQCKDPDEITIKAMNTILGGSFASRLNDNLRERNGFTYGAHSGFDMRLDRGAFVASTDVQIDKTIPAVREMLKEIKGMSVPVPAEELHRALNYLAYTYPSHFETSNAVTTVIARNVSFDYPKDYVDKFVSNVLKTTAEDIKRVAERTLDVSKMKVIIVGDAKVLEKQLQEQGWKAQVISIDELMGPKPDLEK